MITNWGKRNPYGAFWNKRATKAKQIEFVTEPTSFMWASDLPLDDQRPPGTYVTEVNANNGLSASDISDLMASGGMLTGGLASLIHGGGRAGYTPTAATAPAAPAAPDNTGPIILGIGAVVMLGMVGIAMSQQKR